MKKALSLILALVFAFALCGCSLNTDFIVTGSLIDGESEEDMLSGMHAVVSFNAESEPYVLRARLYMEGMEDPIEATLTASSQGLGVYFPMFLDNYYLIDWNAFKEIASETSPVDINTFSSENFNTDDLVDVGQRYVTILMNLMTEDNTTMAEGTFALPGLAEDVACTVLTIAPTKADWDAVITELASTALTDEQLRPLIVTGLETTYNAGQAEDAGEYASAEEYANAQMAKFDEFLTSLKNDPSSLSEQLAGFALEAGYTEDYFYGARLMKEGAGFGYESITYEAASDEEMDTRYDGVYLYSGDDVQAVAANAFSMTEAGFIDYMYSDMADFAAGLSVDGSEMTALDLPVVNFYFGIESFELSAGLANDEGDAVFYLDGIVEDSELYLEARSDGSPSDATAPAEEPVVLTTMEEVMQVFSSVMETAG